MFSCNDSANQIRICFWCFVVAKGGFHHLISCFEQLVEEKRALEEAERRASEEYIQRLLAEEEERMAEERRRQEEQQLENDEKLARLLSQELVRSHIRDREPNSVTRSVIKVRLLSARTD